MKRPSATRRSAARDLFDCWTRVARRIRKAKRLLLLLDFDGTLAGFKRNPEEVRLDESTRRLLERLARHPRLRLGFISGRRRRDLLLRVNVRGAQYWGVHGWERRPGMRLKAASRRQLLQARDLLARQIENLPGVWLEDKQGTLALHYRGASRHATRRALAAADTVVAGFQPPFGILQGKKTWEIMAPEVEGKGATVRHLAAGSPALPIYVGDDVTDEAAFAALRNGLTIRAGTNRGTQARFRVRNPDAVKRFLERLEAELSPRRPLCATHVLKDSTG